MRKEVTIMADTSTNQTPPFNLTKQQQEWVNRETDLLMKLRQAQAAVEQAEDQVAQAQARLDDRREQLQSIQAQLNAMYNEPGAVRQGNTAISGGLPPNETYVGGAVDFEQARTPGQARYDVLQDESQELSQEHAVARDMAQAEDQGVVEVPPENSGQANQG
jgi:chromosome segregation ATPase